MLFRWMQIEFLLEGISIKAEKKQKEFIWKGSNGLYHVDVNEI